MEELKPCPFCASTQQTVKHSGRWGWFVSCECAAVGPSARSKAEAVERWNNRPTWPDGEKVEPRLIGFDYADGPDVAVTLSEVFASAC